MQCRRYKRLSAVHPFCKVYSVFGIECGENDHGDLTTSYRTCHGTSAIGLKGQPKSCRRAELVGLTELSCGSHSYFIACLVVHGEGAMRIQANLSAVALRIVDADCSDFTHALTYTFDAESVLTIGHIEPTLLAVSCSLARHTDLADACVGSTTNSNL
jgi:hypothetical protein